MSTKILKNLTVAKKVGVAHPTIGRWIEDAVQKENNLELEESNSRLYIKDSEHNWAELLKLKEKTVKYRNKIAYEKVFTDLNLNQILTKDQIIELVTSLELRHKIPLKFTYIYEGAHIWNQVYNSIKDEKFYKQRINSLLRGTLEYLEMKTQKNQVINIVEIGVGNGDKMSVIIDYLNSKGKKVNYTGIDISQQMLEFTTLFYKEKYPEMPVKTYLSDIESDMIRDLLFSNKLKNSDSCNLVFCIGSTIGNIDDRDRFLRNIHNSMGKSDLFMLDNGLDLVDQRVNFSTLEHPLYESMTKWLPSKLGMDKSTYSIYNKFDENSREKRQIFILNKDLDISINIDGVEKVISLKENEQIIVWNHYRHTVKSLTQELEKNDFEIQYLSVYPDKSRAVVIVEPNWN
jgi:uncharacterized SAM-dependent methyltransferase